MGLHFFLLNAYMILNVMIVFKFLFLGISCLTDLFINSTWTKTKVAFLKHQKQIYFQLQTVLSTEASIFQYFFPVGQPMILNCIFVFHYKCHLSSENFYRLFICFCVLRAMQISYPTQLISFLSVIFAIQCFISGFISAFAVLVLHSHPEPSFMYSIAFLPCGFISHFCPFRFCYCTQIYVQNSICIKKVHPDGFLLCKNNRVTSSKFKIQNITSL